MRTRERDNVLRVVELERGLCEGVDLLGEALGWEAGLGTVAKWGESRREVHVQAQEVSEYTLLGPLWSSPRTVIAGLEVFLFGDWSIKVIRVDT